MPTLRPSYRIASCVNTGCSVCIAIIKTENAYNTITQNHVLRYLMYLIQVTPHAVSDNVKVYMAMQHVLRTLLAPGVWVVHGTFRLVLSRLMNQ